jgi:hypothetical protein
MSLRVAFFYRVNRDGSGLTNWTPGLGADSEAISVRRTKYITEIHS